jgi:hypothetical protein
LILWSWSVVLPRKTPFCATQQRNFSITTFWRLNNEKY